MLWNGKKNWHRRNEPYFWRMAVIFASRSTRLKIQTNWLSRLIISRNPKWLRTYRSAWRCWRSCASLSNRASLRPLSLLKTRDTMVRVTQPSVRRRRLCRKKGNSSSKQQKMVYGWRWLFHDNTDQSINQPIDRRHSWLVKWHLAESFDS